MLSHMQVLEFAALPGFVVWGNPRTATVTGRSIVLSIHFAGRMNLEKI
jgi:hypothetical protein